MTEARPKRSRHNLKAVMARVKVRGLGVIDKRTRAARDLIAWKNDLLAALGGRENVSPQKLALVDMAVRTRLYIDHIDSFLMEQGTLVNRRRKAILPVLRERTTLVDSLSRALQQIGLDRVEIDAGTLAPEWIIERVQPPRVDEESKQSQGESEREANKT